MVAFVFVLFEIVFVQNQIKANQNKSVLLYDRL
jgi:hypothetical protein